MAQSGNHGEGKVRNSILGAPQGGVISPLLSNIYLNVMDSLWEKKFSHLGSLIRYADDFVILCRTKQQALESIRVIQSIMGKLDLSLHREKSRLVNIWDDSDGFDFLGFHHRKFPIRKKGGRTFFILNHIPSKKAMKKMRKKIKDYTAPRHKLYMDIKDLIKGLNRKLQGFKYYFISFPQCPRGG